MVLIYAPVTSPRLQYIAEFIGTECFGEPLRITTDVHEFRYFEGPRINYSTSELTPDELLIIPQGLLFETGIRPQEVACFELNYHKAFFQTGGDLTFDLFAATFYLLSRYEEYLPHEPDALGRFDPRKSLAYREGFLGQPLVNLWLQEFRTQMQRRFPGLTCKRREFTNLLTYDIDMAYAYRHKGLLRNIGGTIREIRNGEWKLAARRWRVLLGGEPDPFDCFEWLDALHLYCRVKPHYFFLVASRRSRFDKSISPRVLPFRKMVEYYASQYPTGIHPSWQSGDDPQLLREEIEWLEVVGERPVQDCRMHYLRLSLPETYRRLIENGIRRDYSMGYSTVNGFRASAAMPFPWYDLQAEQRTGLTVYPFCFMDSAAHYHLRLSPSRAYEELMSYYELLRRTGGMMITVWHNSTLGDTVGLKGWRAMFEMFMKEIVYWDAYADGAGRQTPQLR